MSDNKRRFTRIPFKVHTELMVQGNVYIAEEISNLSVGGCMLPIVVDLEPQTDCQMKITLSGTTDGITINVDGEIIRSDQDAVAVKFTRIDPESLFHLQNIIRYNSPDADAIEDEINKHPGLK